MRYRESQENQMDRLPRISRPFFCGHSSRTVRPKFWYVSSFTPCQNLSQHTYVKTTMKCKQNLGERGVPFLRAVKSTQRTYSAHFSSSKGSGRNRRSIFALDSLCDNWNTFYDGIFFSSLTVCVRPLPDFAILNPDVSAFPSLLPSLGWSKVCFPSHANSNPIRPHPPPGPLKEIMTNSKRIIFPHRRRHTQSNITQLNKFPPQIVLYFVLLEKERKNEKRIEEESKKEKTQKEKRIFILEARIAEVHRVSKFRVARKRALLLTVRKHYGGETNGETEK